MRLSTLANLCENKVILANKKVFFYRRLIFIKYKHRDMLINHTINEANRHSGCIYYRSYSIRGDNRVLFAHDRDRNRHIFASYRNVPHIFVADIMKRKYLNVHDHSKLEPGSTSYQNRDPIRSYQIVCDRIDTHDQITNVAIEAQQIL